MTILEGTLQTLEPDPADLSPEEVGARQELSQLFGTALGTAVEIIGIQPAMQPFYRSIRHTDRKPEPYRPYETPIYREYPELEVCDAALAIRCWFTRNNVTHIYDGDIWINYGQGNRLNLSEDTIRHLGSIGRTLVVDRTEKIVLTKPEYANEVVARHNRRILNLARYPEPEPVGENANAPV